MTTGYAAPGSPEWERRLATYLADESFPSLWWLSFTDPDRPPSTQFLGVAIIEAANEVAAIHLAHMTGCNPGGQVLAYQLPPEAEKECRPHVNTLMSMDELIRLGLSDGTTLADLED